MTIKVLWYATITRSFTVGPKSNRADVGDYKTISLNIGGLETALTTILFKQVEYAKHHYSDTQICDFIRKKINEQLKVHGQNPLEDLEFISLYADIFH